MVPQGAMIGWRAAMWFIQNVGSGAVGYGVTRSLSADQEKLAFDQLLADVRAICNMKGSEARRMNSRLFRFDRGVQSGSTEYVLLEFDESDHTVRVSVTNASGMSVVRQRAMSPSMIMNSYLPSHNTCSAPAAVLRSAR